MKIPYVNIKKQYSLERKDLLSVIDKSLSSGSWIGGDEVEKFEKNISSMCKTKYCVSLNSGTDALTLGLHLLGVRKGDEVITPPNSFVASTAVIVHLGAKPVFVDVKDDQNIDENLIEKKITKKTKAIMPVHLTGRMCAMDKIMKISKKYNIPVIEDSAQSILSKFKKKMSGSWGDVGCFSTHPLKNLNASGDGGFLTTNNKKIYDTVRNLRSHGMEDDRNNVKNFGYVSRMDNLQAAILNYRIKNLDSLIKIRRQNVKTYLENLNLKNVFVPKETTNEFNTYHTFVVQVNKRDRLKEYLEKNGVGSAIHYPVPIHLQKCSHLLGYKKGSFSQTEKQSKKILSLPINQFLQKNQIIYISSLINKFYQI
ncbi:DegT/DnrJ/EryC1/StrS family aminotransferase [Candidatus Pelagibacter sp.]|nr:DegT/DnrJ/EryC1/StrS family aminotransferase [Candidatus Pelagibacter sp.]